MATVARVTGVFFKYLRVNPGDKIENQFFKFNLQDWVQNSVLLVVGNTELDLQVQNFTNDLSHELTEVTAGVFEVQSKFDLFYQNVPTQERDHI